MITFTEFAAEKAKGMLKANNKLDAGIRIFIKSGGCSGYSYGMSIDDNQLEGDKIFKDRGVKIYVDQMSFPLVDGSEVDFLENMMGGGFSVNNPNATSACGCGSSFRTDGATAPEGEGAPSCG